MLELKFCFKNEFDTKTEFSVSIPETTCKEKSELEILVDEFKNFLKTVSFSENIVEKVQIIDDEQE
ncbi:MAG: hypothetical protein ACOCUI_02865 [bacterium]